MLVACAAPLSAEPATEHDQPAPGRYELASYDRPDAELAIWLWPVIPVVAVEEMPTPELGPVTGAALTEAIDPLGFVGPVQESGALDDADEPVVIPSVVMLPEGSGVDFGPERSAVEELIGGLGESSSADASSAQ